MSGTNRDPVTVSVDLRGMVVGDQGPVSLPGVKFLPNVVLPEFTAGWGADSDGDGLPDIYEILVSKTDPLNTDTGNTGTIDGYKEPVGDGWSMLEKFRRRADPLKAAHHPEPVTLRQPTLAEAMQVGRLKTDLRYEPQVQIRMPGTSSFQTIRQSLMMFYQLSNPKDPQRTRPDFDLRIVWVVPQPRPHEQSYGP
jgi:hypothetical protein